MKTQVIIRHNPLDQSAEETYEPVNGVGDFLYSWFDVWPTTAKIYQDEVRDENEILLFTPDDVKNLNTLTGKIYVVIYPAGLAFIGIALIAATVGIQIWSKSKKSKSAGVAETKKRNQQTGSPNNSLSERQNRARVNERIPDIYGTVRSIPDLITVPYTVYVNHEQTEHAFMCVGRGDLEVSDIRDDDTPIAQIGGASVAVYGPFNSPNSGTAKLEIGLPINEPVLAVKKSNAVNGQKLFPPNAGAIWSYVKFKFTDAGEIIVDNDQLTEAGAEYEDDIDYDFTEYFQVGETLFLRSSYRIVFTGSAEEANVNGDYEITGVTSDTITLLDPHLVNDKWLEISGETEFGTGRLSTNADRKIGPFIFDDVDNLIANVIADEGLYKDNGENQIAANVDVKISVQQVDAEDAPFGSVYELTQTLSGSSDSRSRRAITIRTSIPFSGRVQVEMRRITPKDYAYEGQVSDNVQWESLYGVKSVPNNNFGDVTTIQSLTYATNSALSIKDRKLNCQASRLLPRRVGDNLPFSDPAETSRFTDIVVAMFTDPRLGNRDISELDIDNLYNTYADIISYFGTEIAGEFNHTFDDDNLTFEDTLQIVAEAVFCEPYRFGRTVKFFFEQDQTTSTILFNHRNKIPNSEKRTATFGIFNDKDGVELEYVDGSDGAKVVMYLPEDQTAVNPETVTQFGITNKLQAYFHAWRLWNRIRYQNFAVEFDATAEAMLLNLNERIQVADNTRTPTFDGEIVAQDGLELTLSQPFEFESGKSYTIFVQNVDSTIQGLAISAGSDKYKVILAIATSLPLAVGTDLYARSTYEIVENSSPRRLAFLVEEKDPRDNFITSVKAVNYDQRYYSADKDYINNVVDINGNLN